MSIEPKINTLRILFSKDKFFPSYLSWIGLLCISLGFSCQDKQSYLFERLAAEESGLFFKNEVIEDEQYNILNFTNLYTGSGVGVGDFNKDGLPDLFFGGNIESSKLYLNQGDLKFEDVTRAAGIQTDRWITGVAIVDINQDSWDDIYLCVSGVGSEEKKKNLLFINQKDNTFLEQATAYNLDDASQCTHASFFDYDKDGDLDVYLAVNPTDYKLYNVNNIRKKKVKGEAPSTDKLYRNNSIADTALAIQEGQERFTDVSETAGILIEGYSLGLNTCDLNNDNWPDIYVTNDFLTNDICYINNQDGTFSNQAAKMFNHTSFASMGIDVADINNDAQPDIYVLDMFPEDHYRQKMIMGGGNYDRFQHMLKMGYEPQYSRNTLQLNNGNNTFSEIGQLAGIHQTDWSWSPLFLDFDNDGLKDLFVTNGFRRDLGDLDYINYSNTNPFGDPEARKAEQLKRIIAQPGAQLTNYVFKNKNGLEFEKQSTAWGINEASYSHGMASADLDLDGDMDLIISNVGQEVFLYENKINELDPKNYLKIKLLEYESGQSVLGAKVYVYYNNQVQFIEFNPYRGYQSTIESTLHFGLGSQTRVDSLAVVWPDGSKSLLVDIPANQTLLLQPGKNLSKENKREELVENKPFEAVELVNFQHEEDPQVDFKSQFLLPHQHSKQGPPLAVGDVNQDALEDFFIGGAAGKPGLFFIQQKDGSFIQNSLNEDVEQEDTDCLFFDADGDGDLDLYVVSGGVQFQKDPSIYKDRLYLNEQNVFIKSEGVIPEILSSGACVTSADFDQDGDFDLFIGGRVSPHEYPISPRSYLLENRNGQFVDISSDLLSKVGMVSTALWTDYDQDNDLDLMVAGEFMPITIFKNEDNELAAAPIVIPHSNGWWNCLSAGDFDGDGDLDYLAGNLGLNTNYRASKEMPLSLYAKDFDQNGSIDPILCQYIDGVEYPVVSRDQLLAQIPPIKVRFPNYKAYASATFFDLFKKPERRDMQQLQAHVLESSYFENKGNGSFQRYSLALDLQLAPINQFWVEDIDKDGFLDALAIGNFYASEVATGRYDAFQGAFLKGKGEGSFEIQSGINCGFLASKDTRDLAKIVLQNKEEIFIVSNNEDRLDFFRSTKNAKRIALVKNTGNK